MNDKERITELVEENIKLVDLLRRWCEIENIIGITNLHRETSSYVNQPVINSEEGMEMESRWQ